MIPGSNLLTMAFQIISQQTLIYYKFAGRSLNALGQDVSMYNIPISIKGSFQPVPRRLYQALGLDFQKEYFNFYVPQAIIDIGRDVSSDQLVFNNKTYQCLSNTEWEAIDGWVAVLCVLIAGTPPNSKPIWGFNDIPSVNAYVNFGQGNFSIGADG